MSTRAARGRGRGHRRSSARAGSSSSGHILVANAPVPLATEVESHDRGARDDALSQAMLRVLERVVGASTGGRSITEYESEFLRLSRYAIGIVTTEYERSVRFEDGLRDELRVLIAPQRERDFAALVEKAKIADEVKRAERQDREKDRNHFRRDSGPLEGANRNIKRARVEEPVRAVLVNVVRPQVCRDCGKKSDQIPIVEQRVVQPVRGGLQPPRRRGQGRGGNARRREEGDAPDVITDIGSTHSYVAYATSGSLGVHSEETMSGVSVLSPLGHSVIPNHSGLGAGRDSEWPHVLQISVFFWGIGHLFIYFYDLGFKL
ncbi:hypothetical protein F383_29132 [Gossypium arboreum]|uniref:Uncharacterized protein n=1 Tax=Gossypium arboreum TaxID=29729 RepID=A0A0B0PJJ0_GOSAR|nr:hypothetical protein F383_29132 [Gossypium arboreum]